MIVEKITLRTPSCIKKGLINEKTAKEIKTVLLTSVNTLLNQFGKNNPNGWFCVYNIVGGENTPFPYPWQYIYDAFYSYYEGNGEKAFIATARDMGWFMLEVLNHDSRKFETTHKSKNRKKVRSYRWVE